MMPRFWRVNLGISLLGIWIGGAIALDSVALASRSPEGSHLQAENSENPEFIRPHTTCPDDLETLTEMLLRDVPGYANRVSQRSRRRERSVDVYSRIILAGRPEFTPLTLGPGAYIPSAEAHDLQQVFFTTLERQYIANRLQRIQHYHWLFLAQTEQGWWFAMMVSRVEPESAHQSGSQSGDSVQSPPYDSSQGVIARAIRLWLRDCKAGAIAPLDPSYSESL